MWLLWTYSLPLDRATWVAVLRSAANPATASRHADLARRWPRLIASALAYRPEGVEWAASLGIHAEAGLKRALRHKSARVRRGALQILQRWPGPQRAFQSQVEGMAREDGNSDVRALAAETLRRWLE